jgi:hypothetical protein
MTIEASAAPVGGDGAAAPEVSITTRTAGGEGPLSIREAGRSLLDARRKDAAQARDAQTQQTSAPAAAAATTESAHEAGAAPPVAEVPGETQETDPAATLPPIEAPRSWTKDEKERWQALPRETQEYIASREQDREREVRRSQNEAAEKLKGMTAREQALEQARQQYETALPALLQTLQQTQAGEFADIRTLADVEKLAAEDWPRYVRWDASQKKIAAVAQELRGAQERQVQEAQTKFSEFAKRQDELFHEKAPEFADKAQAAKLQDAAIGVLRDLGFEDAELTKLWNGQAGLSLRDHRVQLLIRDGLKYRDAQAAAKKTTAAALPPVQRPGAAQPRGAAKEAEMQTLSKQLDNAHGMDALRAAAKLVASRRASAR